MTPCEGCALRSGDWCLRLSWSGTPVTSFRWGHVVTINVSPGGTASPACRDAPHRPPVTPCAQTGEPRVIENAPQTANTAPAGTDREPSDASSTSGHPHPADHHPRGDIPRGRVRVVPGGGLRRRRGQQSRPRTRHLSPAAQKCPRTRRMPPAAVPECGVFMPRPKTPVRRAGFDCRYSPPPAGGDPAARSHSDGACHLLHEGRVYSG